MKGRIAAVLAILVLAAASLSAKRAPSLDLKDLAGHPQKLSALRGQIVVLSFWATWCGPCKEELPRLSALSQTYAGKNISFVAVSIDEARDLPRIQPFVEQNHIGLNVWIGADSNTLDHFGLGNIVPGTVILDDQGEIVARVMGEARDEDVRSAVDWLLNHRQGAAPAALTKRY
jgi:thiol-disulfide isomerase/thioredoxin